MDLNGKKIILGVTGSIAAYKAAMLTRLLVKAGASVQVIMTAAAREFITPLTLSTLSKNPALADLKTENSDEWNNHVALGLWADAMIIAPASAHTLAKMSHGLCDNLLLATYLSARCPIFVAPAMDLDMLKHPSTEANLTTLANHGVHLIQSSFGELASGLIGDGRMAEPEEILQHLSNHFSNKKKLNGKKVLVTSGPTYEALDPVRFIGNHSTGKMGVALAEALANQGAMVELIAGPSSIHTKHPSINVTHVVSSDEMYQACTQLFPTVDIAVLAAAVADYKPKSVADQKIKKNGTEMTLELIKTHDIAMQLGKVKKVNQLLIGFALETENEVDHAQKKLTEKNFDLIILNSLNDKGAGFGHDTNKITILDSAGSQKKFELKTKKEVAEDIVEAITFKIAH